MPGFLTLDRFDLESRAGAEVAMLARHDIDGAAFRIDTHGQYVIADSRFGIAAALPMVIAGGMTETRTLLGNLELDGFGVHTVTPGFDIVARAGFTLPTSPPRNGDKLLGEHVTQATRPIDGASIVPAASIVRLAVSSLVHRCAWFARADLGVDLEFHGDGMTSESVASIASSHASVGGGVELPHAAITLELATLVFRPATAALAVRGNLGRLQPYAGVVVPLDSETRAFSRISVVLGLDVTVE